VLDVAQLASPLADFFISPKVFPLGSCLGNNETKVNDAQKEGLCIHMLYIKHFYRSSRQKGSEMQACHHGRK
jgi:hypothetical protein